MCVKCHKLLQKSKEKPLPLLPHQEKSLISDNPVPKQNLAGTIQGKQAFGENLPPPVPVQPPTLPDNLLEVPMPPPVPNNSPNDDEVKTIVCPYPDCGFINIAPRITCIKCQRELYDANAENNQPPLTPNEPIPKKVEEIETTNEEEVETAEKPSSKTPNYMKTIDPYRMRVSRNQKCYMHLVPKMNETIVSGKGAEFELLANESVELNRDNIDQTNTSITSKVQAELSYENGRWFLIDRSEQQTTFIQVSEKIEIKDGDMILMGDRKLIFSTEEEEKKRLIMRT